MTALLAEHIEACDLPPPRYEEAGDALETIELTSDQYRLVLQETEMALRIIRLRVTLPGCGHGRQLVEALIEYCREHERMLIAIDVAPEREGFWSTMGFQVLEDGSRDWIHRSGLCHYQHHFC